MDMWTIPFIITFVIILVISYYMTLGVMKKTSERAAVHDAPISKNIKEHPLLLNPIIIMYVILFLFTGIIIFYYWSQYKY